MPSLINYKYDNKLMSQIKSWHFGTNWPVVYIYYNNQKAYVGETLDALRRTEQHLMEKEFDEFTDVCFISDKTFNKSVILDLESFLIKYLSADKDDNGKSRKLINGNAGITDHNYFYKEAYEDDFKEIWRLLFDNGIVHKSIIDIENSELFKYSPFKSLNNEQLHAFYEILKRLYEVNNATTKSLIEVIGGAGTGKTILAVYIVKLLADINRNKKVWNSIKDYEDALFIKKIAEKISGIKKIGFVVPMVELRSTMSSIFASIDGLSEDMVLSPEQVVRDYYDVLVVDEAHRLYQRKHLPGSHLYKKFDMINRKIMAEGTFTASANDYTELDWIMKSSRMQVLFYDSRQTIRSADIDRTRFDYICKPHLYKYIELFSQMRCKGGNGYYDYVKTVLFGKKLTLYDYKHINQYELKVVDDVQALFGLINEKNHEYGLSRVVTGPGWGIKEDIIIDGKHYHWAGDKKNWNDADKIKETIFSIHKTQGFDLNYAGVIFGKEVYFDTKKECIAINKSELKDDFTKSSGDDAMLQYILNIYLTLMTRGMQGTYVYAVDKDLNDYLKRFLDNKR